MKDFLGILGLIIGLVTFSVWFYIAKDTYPDVPRYAIRIFYSGYFISASMFLGALGLGCKENKLRHLIFYAGSNAYAILMFSYFLNWHLDILIGLNKIIFTLLLTVLSCIVYYFYSYKS